MFQAAEPLVSMISYTKSLPIGKILPKWHKKNRLNGCSSDFRMCGKDQSMNLAQPYLRLIWFFSAYLMRYRQFLRNCSTGIMYSLTPA